MILKSLLTSSRKRKNRISHYSALCSLDPRPPSEIDSHTICRCIGRSQISSVIHELLIHPHKQDLSTQHLVAKTPIHLPNKIDSHTICRCQGKFICFEVSCIFSHLAHLQYRSSQHFVVIWNVNSMTARSIKIAPSSTFTTIFLL